MKKKAKRVWVIETKPPGENSAWNICWGEGSMMVFPTRKQAKEHAIDLQDCSEERDKFRAVCYMETWL